MLSCASPGKNRFLQRLKAKFDFLLRPGSEAASSHGRQRSHARRSIAILVLDGAVKPDRVKSHPTRLGIPPLREPATASYLITARPDGVRRRSACRPCPRCHRGRARYRSPGRRCNGSRSTRHQPGAIRNDRGDPLHEPIRNRPSRCPGTFRIAAITRSATATSRCRISSAA